ncbi:MAG: hypothetical protein JWO14_2341 [Solirubrobacterales bacterium]|nr:hypothetical protein [Solirubrobacterales bacterium]
MAILCGSPPNLLGLTPGRSGSQEPHRNPETVSADRDDSLAKLAEEFGLDPPRFDGPLQAFDMAPDSEKGIARTIYLGGDLHAVHPDASERRPRPERDDSLDAATITFDDLEQEKVEAVAVAGIWCLVLRGEQVDSAPTSAFGIPTAGCGPGCYSRRPG